MFPFRLHSHLDWKSINSITFFPLQKEIHRIFSDKRWEFLQELHLFFFFIDSQRIRMVFFFIFFIRLILSKIPIIWYCLHVGFSWRDHCDSNCGFLDKNVFCFLSSVSIVWMSAISWTWVTTFFFSSKCIFFLLLLLEIFNGTSVWNCSFV